MALFRFATAAAVSAQQFARYFFLLFVTVALAITTRTGILTASAFVASVFAFDRFVVAVFGNVFPLRAVFLKGGEKVRYVIVDDLYLRKVSTTKLLFVAGTAWNKCYRRP